MPVRVKVRGEVVTAGGGEGVTHAFYMSDILL